MNRLLVIGASGLLGTRLMSDARSRAEYEVYGTCNPEVDGDVSAGLEPLDLCSGEQVGRLLDRLRPSIVLLAAAMTNVDACETSPVLAHGVNAEGPGIVAWACKRIRARLVYVSTDYVFDGEKGARYTEEDEPRPISVYGASKLAGERAVLSALPEALVARPAVLYGWNPIEGKDNFVTWVLKRFRGGERATLFEDQWISPTFADDLARTLLDLAERDLSGVWHVSGPDCLDRPACGRMIAKEFGLDERLVVPVASSSVDLPARRPARSCLDASKVEKLLNRKMLSFEEGLRAMRQQEARLG